VLPSFDRTGKLVYAQTRYLDVDCSGRKYDNPASRHATKPTLSWPRQLGDDDRCTVICEGVIDALTVAGIGIRSVALLSAGDASRVLTELSSVRGRLVIATDPDEAGRNAARTLQQSLKKAGVREVQRLELPVDVNDFARQAAGRFPGLFRMAARESALRNRAAQGLGR